MLSGGGASTQTSQTGGTSDGLNEGRCRGDRRSPGLLRRGGRAGTGQHELHGPVWGDTELGWQLGAVGSPCPVGSSPLPVEQEDDGGRVGRPLLARGLAASRSSEGKSASTTGARHSTAISEEMKTRVPMKTCTLMSKPALSVIAPEREIAQCPLIDEWVRKRWPIHTGEYCSALKRNRTLIYASVWMNL